VKLLICGYGFVGKAHALALEGVDVTTHVYDPAKGFDAMISDPDAAIIAVATPMGNDGSCDMSAIYDCLEKIPEDIPILIKSTISLEGWKLIKRAYPLRAITFSPEFLRANHAMEDFKNQKVIYLGGSDPGFWISFISNKLDVTVEVAEAEELILAKYFRNSFLATKVAFFNQIYDLCDKLDIEYSAVAHYVTEDPRIGDSHSFITEKRGFGGHCLPKDVSAMISTAMEHGYDLSVLKEVMEYNERLQNEKNSI